MEEEKIMYFKNWFRMLFPIAFHEEDDGIDFNFSDIDSGIEFHKKLIDADIPHYFEYRYWSKTKQPDSKGREINARRNWVSIHFEPFEFCPDVAWNFYNILDEVDYSKVEEIVVDNENPVIFV